MLIVLHGRLEALRRASIANRVVCMAGETLRPRVCVSLNAASRKTLNNNSPAEGIGCLPLARNSIKSRSIQVTLKEDG
jgi:hypothetical protein